MKKANIYSVITLFFGTTSILVAQKPNVVLIISDQHQFGALGCYGSQIKTVNGESPTPNIDKLASKGVLFTNAYTVSPLSAPARASLMTGVYPHQHTAIHHKENNKEPGHVRYPGILESLPTIGEVFRKSGYATAAIGKMHVHGEQKEINDLGFDYSNLRFYTYYPGAHYSDYAEGDWNKRYREMREYANMKYRDIDPVRFSNAPENLLVKENGINQYFLETLVEKESQTIDYLVAEDSERFIRYNIKANKNFFIHVGFEKPHDPYTTHKKYMDMFNPDEMILPDSWNDVNKLGQYPFLMNWLTQKHGNEKKAKNTIAGYYACVRSLDEQVGKIIQVCEELDILDNTIFIYTTDHGDHLYNHSMLQKHCMFETAVKIPLILSYPAKVKKNRSSHALVSLLDILPTILELSDNNVPETFKGVSLMKSIDNEANNERLVFSEFYEAGKQYKMFPEAKSLPMRMCRYKQFKYIYTHGFIEQLYNLDKDPNENNNLVLNDFNSYRKLIEQLRLATLNGWAVDEYPLLNVKMNRKKGKIIFECEKQSDVQSYMLYRSDKENPMSAQLISESKDEFVYDDKPLDKENTYYWIVSVPKLSRTFNNSIVYKGVPVATQTLQPKLPATVGIIVKKEVKSAKFAYKKMNIYN